MSLLGKKLYLGVITLAFFLMFIPLVNAFTVEGPVNFVGDGGGNVTFVQNFNARALFWANTLNRFSNFVWGGNNVGAIGFDCDTGTNMTVIYVTDTQIKYNISNPIVGLSTQRVFYGDKGEPDIIGGVITGYNGGTNIVEVTTLGNADVLLTYLPISTGLNNTGIALVSIFLLIAIIVAFTWENGTINTKILITFLIVIALVMLFSTIFESWGF